MSSLVYTLGKRSHARSLSSPLPVSMYTSIFGSANVYTPLRGSEVNIVRPKGAIAFATSSGFVPAGNVIFSVLASALGSTLTCC